MLLGKSAPLFTARGVNAKDEIFEFSLETHINKNSTKGVVLFFYPLNFTFVCPTELVILHKNYSEFEKRGIVLAAISVDSEFSHLAWRNTKRSDGGIGQISYPLLSDLNKEISKSYNVLLETKSIAARATFFLDGDGIIRSIMLNDSSIGRGVSELLRIIDAWKHYEKHGEVCPADWKNGDSGMKATRGGVEDYMVSHDPDNELLS